MEEQTKPYSEPDIIICDDIPDTIPLTAKKKKRKKVKKPNSKCKRSIDFYNMDNLIITRKLKVKKKKFKCIININPMCKSERSASIVRSAYNVCKKEAYYQRIVPICLRKMCSGEGYNNCCRSTLNRECKDYRNPKVGSLSPVSSIPLTDVFGCNNISYEDVSNGSFSTDSESEDELDTLIKRTKQRERQSHYSYPARDYASTPLSKADHVPTSSPYSFENDKKSIHSEATMVLHPISSETYSPTASLDIKIENNEETIDILPSPTISPDIFQMVDYSPIRTDDFDYNSPYTTQERIDTDASFRSHPNDINAPTIFANVSIKTEKDIIPNDDHENELYSFTMTPCMIKKEYTNSELETTNCNDDNINVSYSPSRPTEFQDHTITSYISGNSLYKHFDISTIKKEKMDDDGESTISCANIAIAKNFIKKEYDYKDGNNYLNSYETDYNMNNTNVYKNEKDKSQISWK